jgi:hypothetical protein
VASELDLTKLDVDTIKAWARFFWKDSLSPPSYHEDILYSKLQEIERRLQRG